MKEILNKLHYQIEIPAGLAMKKIITCKNQATLIEQLKLIEKDIGKENFQKNINKEIKIYAIGEVIYNDERNIK